MRSQVTTGVAGFFQANHFGAVSALLFSIILSACSGGYDNPESNDYVSPSLTVVTVQDADAPLRNDVVLGGTFQINITADEAIIAPTVMINGLAADSVAGAGTSWTASKVMTEDDADGEITFNISFTDLNTNPGADVSATTDGSTITYCATGCGTGGTTDDGTTDGGTTDGGSTDGDSTDGGSTDGGSAPAAAIEMVEGFGGALVENDVFSFPAGAEVWAGFANLNVDVYPLTFANGGTVTFTAAVPAGGADTSIYFRFEKLPHPDTEPSFNLDSVLISGEAEQQYTVTIPAQDSANTYSSFLMYVVEQDSPVMVKDIVVTDDTGSTGGAGSTDGGATDGGSTDGGSTDGGSTDGGSTDGGSTDGGSTDGGSTDGGSELTAGVEMIEGFGGAVFDEAASSFTFPAGSEVWAGFANLNVDIYPFTFANGGSITFTAAVAAGGADTNVYFRFERLPFPDVDPSFNLDPVLIVGETELEYTITIPAQDAANTYESFLLYVVEQDQTVIIKDIVVNDDGGSSDDVSGTTDGGSTDGGSTDGGSTDGGSTDGGSTDGGATDGGTAGVEMIEGFGGAVFDEAASSYTFPAGSEVWAGFANLNVDIYPFTFANGGSITFTAAVAAGGADTNVYFRFERLPFPDVDPSFDLEQVLIVGETELEYTVTIPPQDAANTYESFLLYVVEQDQTVIIKDIVVNDDGGSSDDVSGTTDGGSTDGGSTDGGDTDGGDTDGGATDGGATDGDAEVSDIIDMTGSFGGAVLQGSTYGFPTGSEVWAGFANLNTDVYPFTFVNAGSITFTAFAGVDTSIYFRFEKLPHPDTEPSFNLDPILISGAEQEYTVTVPAQDAANTYESFLMYVVDQDQAVKVTNIVVTHDGGSTGLPQEATYEAPSSPGIEVLNEAAVTTEWGGNASMNFAACGFCAEISQATVSDDQRGDVLQISYSDNAGHAVLVIENTDTSVDVSAFTELSFDIKILNIDAGVGFNLITKSAGSNQPPVDITPADSEFWQTVTVPVTEFGGVDLTAVTAPFIIFPDVNQGAGLVYQLDDIRWQ